MANINGTSYADYLVGTNKADFIQGYDGSDVLYGREGNDQILGQDGNDYLDGGNGKDTLYGGDGYDIIFGGNGNDYIDGGDKSDRLYGEYGNDFIKGGSGNDLLNGWAGNDSLLGGDGHDTYTGFSKYTGHDVILDDNIATPGGDDVDLNYFISDTVKYRTGDVDHDGNPDTLRIGFASGADITILNYFANDGTFNPGTDSNINFHFADTTFDFSDVVNHLGNIPV